MNASDYQKQAARTLIDAPGFDIPDTDMMIVWNALGLAGEAGEVAEMVKKGILHQHGIDHEKLAKELGDVCWYLAALCTKCGFDLGEIMAANIEKLKVRYPDGFRAEDSVRRVDTVPTTKTLRMYGASDDLIEVEGIPGEDEYSGMTKNGTPYVTAFEVRSPSEPVALHILVLYAGAWSFAVHPTDASDDYGTFPDWPIRRSWGGGLGYSELLEIDVPSDAAIEEIKYRD